MENNDRATIPSYVVTDPVVQRKLSLLLTICIFFSVLNGTMFNVSVPDIAKEFGLLPSEVSWVVSAYVILFALGSVTYGKLADTFSVKNLITTGLILLNIGSVVGFLSQWYPMLILARVVQATGSSAIPALAMLIATKYFPGAIRGRVLGMIASTVAFGGGIGPMVGGFITGTFHWRYLFLFSVATLFTIRSFRRFLPDEARQASTFDITGALLMGVGIVLLLLSVTTADWRFLPAAFVLLIVFRSHIQRSGNPFVSPSLFRNRRYRNTVIIAFLAISTVFGMVFMTPIMLRALNELSANDIGLAMFPGAMTAALMGALGGKLVDRIGSKPVVFIGLACLATGFLLISIFAGFTPWVIALGLIVSYTGFSFTQPSLAHTVSASLPNEHMGIGMGMYNLFFFMSGAFSAAVIGKMLDVTAGDAPVNPLAVLPSAGSFSNLYLLLSCLVLIAASLFFFTFPGSQKEKRV